MTDGGKTVTKALGFFLLSSAATCFPMLLAKMLWPHGGSADAEYMFWIASGVNAAGLLLLGWKYFPCIALNGLPAHFLVAVPLPVAIFGSCANAVEALLVVWILRGLGKFDGAFDRVRTVGALLLSAVAGPLPGALAGARLMVACGLFPESEYGAVVSGWIFGNGGAILLLTPMLVAAWRRDWPRGRAAEFAGWILSGSFVGVLTFDTVLRGGATNFVFLLFPFVIFAGVRLGTTGVAAALFLVLLSIYASLVQSAPALPLAEIPKKVWFVQAFSWVLAATGMMVAALSAERRRAERQTLAEQGRRMEASLREERARLDALRYQMNPHFLFNALNSIRSELPLSLGVPREMITELAEYLRATIDRPETDTMPLRAEVDSARHYLAIEQKRFGDRLRVDVRLDDAVAETPVPVFLLQPLVENAIRHGLEASRETCEIRISARAAAGSLRIEVANSGTWQDTGSRKSVGLENIRRRLALLHGGRAHLHSSASDGWVTMRIELPA